MAQFRVIATLVPIGRCSLATYKVLGEIITDGSAQSPFWAAMEQQSRVRSRVAAGFLGIHRRSSIKYALQWNRECKLELWCAAVVPGPECCNLG